MSLSPRISLKLCPPEYGTVSLVRRSLAWVITIAVVVTSEPLPANEVVLTKDLPLSGEVFAVDGNTAFLLPAAQVDGASGRPWVWYAPTLPGLPGVEERWMFEQFLRAGIAVAGVDVGESYGCPAGQEHFTRFYVEMTERRGYSDKPVLLGRSRGGLMTLAWGANHPEKISAFAGIYPVCNLQSYPGLEKAAPAYGITPDALSMRLAEFNPIERLAPLARQHVPLFAIHGDSDQVVPLDQNSQMVHDRYVALGGSMQLLVPAGQGHNMWEGFFQCQELVDFVMHACGVPSLVVDSPRRYQVFQRMTAEAGPIEIRGHIKANSMPDRVEVRLVTEGRPQAWRDVAFQAEDRHFYASIDGPAGGWYQLDIRATAAGRVLAEKRIEPIGIGEVFVVAGQSNSANYGEERQKTRTGLVSARGMGFWQLALDPQPGAGGDAGSFMPLFGDAIAEQGGVPVGIVACGVGATSVREWLPAGIPFPNPPTLEGNVRQRADGTWESTGVLFETLVTRMESLGPHGFRAVLWHQGESDANQPDAKRTLPGRLYREYLTQLIQKSRQRIGWEAPWYVAQVSYHTPQDSSSPDLRAAQADLWKEGIALQGPDTDSLRGPLRDGQGQGVHFSAAGLRELAKLWAQQVGPHLPPRKVAP